MRVSLVFRVASKRLHRVFSPCHAEDWFVLAKDAGAVVPGISVCYVIFGVR